MASVTARAPRGAGAWERIVYGVRYWFDATPYEIKVFRLNRDGGDLVHHLRDEPVASHRYDRFTPSTKPRPGEVAWVPHWDRRQGGRLYVTSCRVCADVVTVTHTQLVEPHGDRYGAATCPASGTAATLKAALVREAELSPGEAQAKDAAYRWWYRCWGYDPVTREECHHPVCDTRPRIRR
ncbi:hypothetical protein ACFY1Q_11780 [Streptomyces albidoflavus]